MTRLSGKRAFVTGGRQGIGRGIVEAFLREGAEVMTCGRGDRPKGLDDAVQWMALDVADAEAVERAAKTLARTVYQDARLRPRIDEPVARLLLGKRPADDDAKQRELADVVAAVRAGEQPIKRRLLTSLCEELRCELVLLVGGTPEQPRARVLRVSDGRTLAAKSSSPASRQRSSNCRATRRKVTS